MKAKELMIGDWVQSEQLVAPARYSGFFRRYPAPMSGKPYTRLECLYEGDREGGEVPEDKVMPIPLTPEILEKNGWKEAQFWHEYKDEKNTIQACLPDMRGRINGIEIQHFNCEYVHQYQHLLRLCGLNELADNFIVE